jgi:ERCC4-type nuclease
VAPEARPAHVIVDVFERGTAVPAALQALGAVVHIEALSSGDYRPSRTALIERKTVADLHGSLGRGRLFAQIGRMRDEVPYPYLLIEGTDLDAGPRHPNAIRGALLAIGELGVVIVRSRDAADTALWIHRIAVREQRRSSRARTVPRADPPGVAALAGVPGISLGLARALIARFGSIEGVLTAGPEAWATVDGVGPVRVEALAAALRR